MEQSGRYPGNGSQQRSHLLETARLAGTRRQPLLPLATSQAGLPASWTGSLHGSGERKLLASSDAVQHGARSRSVVGVLHPAARDDFLVPHHNRFNTSINCRNRP